MRRLHLYSLFLIHGGACWAGDGGVFEFFREEARVITPSRRSLPVARSPATVYVIEAEELEDFGAQNLWDALRDVHGVDVMSVRSVYGAVSIRGLSKVLNNRTLVLVDGRRVLEGVTDRASWQTLPVLLEEIDRIEVVEGPASALYGANAVNGVINIISKAPQQVEGGRASYALGERQTHRGSLLYGSQRPGLGFKVGGAWRTTDSFEDPGAPPGRVAKVHGMAVHELRGAGRLTLEGGATSHEADLSLGGLGWGRQEGDKAFLQAELIRGATRVRSLWNGSWSHLRDFTFLGAQTELDYDTVTLSLEHAAALSPDHDLVLGGEIRRNVIDAEIVAARHELWALFFEHEWRPDSLWAVWTSGRLDRHPLAGLVLSPRLSLVYAPVPRHMLRLSAGSSFRNPTLLENHLQIARQVELSETVQVLDLSIAGEPGLEPERMLFLEAAHRTQLGPVKTTIAAFHYRLEDVISVSEPTLHLDQGRLAAEATFVNKGAVSAWGGELGAQLRLHRQMRGFANYAYQRLRGAVDGQAAAGGTPHHKVNVGLRGRRDRFRWGVAIHWVSRTRWNTNQLYLSRPTFMDVDGYVLVNGHLGYSFGGRLQGLELGFDAFNMLDNQHYETLPMQNTLAQGQGAELIRSRRLLRLDYRF